MRPGHGRSGLELRGGGRMSHGLLLSFEVTILVLAIFLGFEVISKVPTLLHTPLMSGTNAIHGIVIVGAMLVAGLDPKDALTTVLGLIAVALGSPKCVCGFGPQLPNLLSLIPIVPFILALRFLSNPATARRGNQIGAVGMLVAIVVTFLQKSVDKIGRAHD